MADSAHTTNPLSASDPRITQRRAEIDMDELHAITRRARVLALAVQGMVNDGSDIVDDGDGDSLLESAWAVAFDLDEISGMRADRDRECERRNRDWERHAAEMGYGEHPDDAKLRAIFGTATDSEPCDPENGAGLVSTLRAGGFETVLDVGRDGVPRLQYNQTGPDSETDFTALDKAKGDKARRDLTAYLIRCGNEAVKAPESVQ